MFIAGFVVHVALKLPAMIRALRSRSLLRELRTNLARHAPGAAGRRYLVRPAPAAADDLPARRAGLRRRGFAPSRALSVGQSLGGPLRWTALLAPHGQDRQRAPTTSRSTRPRPSAGIREAETGDGLAAHPRAARSQAGCRSR